MSAVLEESRWTMLAARGAIGIVLALAALLGGCAGETRLAPVELRDGYKPAPAGFYRVLRGDTLTAVSRRTGQSLATLAAWNQLEPPYRINVGSLLRVAPPGRSGTRRPGSDRRGKPGSDTEAKVNAQEAARDHGRTAAQVGRSNQTAKADGVTWQWPLGGAVQQNFQAGNRSRQGIRIQASPGAEVAAAAKGTVVYSGSGLKGYGNLIIVKHNDRYLSVYGFNRRLIAQQGDKVRAGQVLAETGQAPGGGYLLHFEIRRDGATVNPLDYLPRR